MPSETVCECNSSEASAEHDAEYGSMVSLTAEDRGKCKDNKSNCKPAAWPTRVWVAVGVLGLLMSSGAVFGIWVWVRIGDFAPRRAWVTPPLEETRKGAERLLLARDPKNHNKLPVGAEREIVFASCNDVATLEKIVTAVWERKLLESTVLTIYEKCHNPPAEKKKYHNDEKFRRFTKKVDNVGREQQTF